MTNAELERAITAWLVQQGLEADDEAPLLEGLCERLVAGGVPLWRAATGAKLLHPLLDARGCRWRRGQGIVKEEYSREGEGEVDEEAWRQSPFHHLVHHARGGELRRRLDPSYRRGEFPLLDAFKDEGATDYLAFSIDYGIEPRLGWAQGGRAQGGRAQGGRAQGSRAQGLLCSFQTDRPGGFREEETALLRRLAPVLALAFKAIAGMETARTLATTYLGEDAGRRVLHGAIARGVAETVRAVLWYSDLRGFTRLADTAPRDVLIALLNAYADAVVSIVHAHGGQVLKFIGDGILAMFPLRNDALPCGASPCDAPPCVRALDATIDALRTSDRLGRERAAAGEPTTDIHIALHVGDVLYGNIGSRDRLDFTVVGPAVNEVARIERLCRTLDRRVIVSTAFAEEGKAVRGRLVRSDATR